MQLLSPAALKKKKRQGTHRPRDVVEQHKASVAEKRAALPLAEQQRRDKRNDREKAARRAKREGGRPAKFIKHEEIRQAWNPKKCARLDRRNATKRRKRAALKEARAQQ